MHFSDHPKIFFTVGAHKQNQGPSIISAILRAEGEKKKKVISSTQALRGCAMEETGPHRLRAYGFSCKDEKVRKTGTPQPHGVSGRYKKAYDGESVSICSYSRKPGSEYWF